MKAGELPLKRYGGRDWGTRDARARVREIERNADRSREHDPRAGHEVDRERDRKLQEHTVGSERAAKNSSRWDRGIESDRIEPSGPGRDAGHEKMPEPKQKSVDMDLGL